MKLYSNYPAHYTHGTLYLLCSTGGILASEVVDVHNEAVGVAADHLTHLVLVYPLVILCVCVWWGGGRTCSFVTMIARQVGVVYKPHPSQRKGGSVILQPCCETKVQARMDAARM